MKLLKNTLLCLVLGAVLSGCGNSATGEAAPTESERNDYAVSEDTAKYSISYVLPPPDMSGDVSVEEALASRRSRRNFADRELTAEQLSQILWAAYGITEPADSPSLRGGLRTAPSAGALYPLEIYAVAGNVTGIEPGVYRYISSEHRIVKTVDGDIRERVSEVSLNQDMLKQAPVTVVFAAVYERITERYGERGRERYVYMEIGHSAQNVYLQAEALGLGTCAVGAFSDAALKELLLLPDNEEPLYLMPVGYY